MSIHRRAARRDANEAGIVKALREIGCLVEPISGEGVPDLIVWAPELMAIILLEVKDGAKPPSARKLKPAQEAFHRAWSSAPVFVVESIEDAIYAVRPR
jgi:hypothetical protein